jgi:hypothetical protein
MPDSPRRRIGLADRTAQPPQEGVRMTHRWIRPLHDTLLTALVIDAKLDDHEAARRMRFSVSTIQVNRERLGLSCNVKKSEKQHTEPVIPAPKEKPNPLRLAGVWLGLRLRETPDGFRLDGVPVNLTAVMRETNRLLKAAGMEQIVCNEAWRL